MEAPRRGPALAIAAVSAAAALTLARVFDDASFLPPVLGAALLPHAVGWLGRTRRWPASVVLLTSGLLLVLYLGWTVVPGTTLYGLPTPDTLAALGDAWTQGWEITRDLQAPVPVLSGPLLLAVVGTWIVAESADLLAFEGRAGVGALFPGVVLFLVAGTTGTDTHRSLVTVVFALTAALALLVQQADVTDGARAWFAPRRAGATRWGLGRGLGAVAVALVAALALTPLLPGGAEPLVDYRELVPGDDGGEFRPRNPVLDIRNRLVDLPEAVMFTAEGPKHTYRLVTLDEFTGTEWQFSEAGFDDATPQGDLDPDDGLPTRSARFDVEIANLGGNWLPAPYRPVDVDGTDIGATGDRPDLFVEDELEEGDAYTVTSAIYPEINAADVPQRPPSGELVTRYTRLPGGMDALRAEAERIVAAAGADTDYARARALRDHFLGSGFEYSTDVSGGHAIDTIEDFVFVRREGYCEQFATAFGAMARTLGLPTRVVVGFLPGERDPATGRWVVRGTRAHAWAEVHFEGAGWLPFDATPGNGAGEAVAGDHAASAGSPPGAAPEPPPGAQPEPTDPPQATAPTAPPAAAASPEGDVGATAEGGLSSGVLVAISILAVLIVLPTAFAAAVVLLKRRRRTRRRRRGDTRDRVEGAWTEALDRLAEAGVVPDVAHTPLEFAHRAESEAGAASGALRTLAKRYTAACYATEPPSDSAVGEAWEATVEIDTALVTGTGRGTTLRRRLDPRSLRRR